MTTTAEVTFTRKFSAAHRIATDPGVCQRIHGHNYRVEITVKRISLGKGRALNDEGFVVPADLIKDIVDRKYDHKLILAASDKLGDNITMDGGKDWVVYVPGPPSTENMAQWIANDVAELMRHAEDTICNVFVKVYETDTIQAWATA